MNVVFIGMAGASGAPLFTPTATIPGFPSSLLMTRSKKFSVAGIAAVLAEVERDICRKHVLRVVTSIDLLQLDKAADHQPCANQQYKAQCHLSGNQHITQAQPTALYRGIGAAFFE